MTYDRRFDEQWEEDAWDDATAELTSTRGRTPPESEIEARVAELWDQAETAIAEATAESHYAAREARFQSDWDEWVGAM